MPQQNRRAARDRRAPVFLASRELCQSGETKKKPRTTLRDSVATFLSWSFLSRKTTEISIPVAFDKQKSNFLIGPSALWWRDAFAISSSLLREDYGEDDKNNSDEKEDDVHENDDAAMADLGHAAEATLDLARVVSGTLLADLRRCAILISFFYLSPLNSTVRAEFYVCIWFFCSCREEF